MPTQSSFTKREWLLVVALAGVTFMSALCASLQAPFYPHEAEKKGATATEYGLVFGVFELVAFITCPIFGKYMGRLGTSFVLKSGIIIAGVSTILFGLLDLVTVRWGFIGLSLLVRIIESIGTSAILTATLSIVVLVFSESFARVLAYIEILQGLGYMVGPTVGGYLFEIGGFMCPFMVVGCCVLVNGLFVYIILPNVDYSEEILKSKVPISAVLKLIPVSLDVFCMIVEAMSVGFLAATLEPHLRQFLLSPTAMGAMFIISGGVYTVVAPVVGIMCDKRFNMKIMILVGSLLVISGFALIGPLPFTPLETSLWMVGLGLVLEGLGTALIFVPAFVDAIVSAVKYGLPDDISTFAIISGIYGSSFALGAFIGPSVAGILFDAYGFRQATLFIIVAHILVCISMTWFACIEKKYERKYNVIRPVDFRYGDLEVTCSNENAAEIQPLLGGGSTVKVVSQLPTAVTSFRKLSGYNSIRDDTAVDTHTC